MENYRKEFRNKQRIVIKLGTSTITHAETGALKAYVFENVLDASLVAGATELTLGE